MAGGRPTKYSPELVDKICEQIAEGKSLRTICLAEDMPGMSSIFKWLGDYKEFSDKYEKAKLEQAEALTEDMLAIADDMTDDAQSRRIRVDTRKWIASKLKPKKYGDKIHQEVTGKDGGPVEYKSLSDQELNERIEKLISQGKGDD